jgi:hypothetical protein
MPRHHGLRVTRTDLVSGSPPPRRHRTSIARSRSFMNLATITRMSPGWEARRSWTMAQAHLLEQVKPTLRLYSRGVLRHFEVYISRVQSMFGRLLSLLVLSAFLRGQVKRSEPLKVCDVLSNLSLYRGQRISVRGQLVGGDEGSYLIGEGCRQLVTDGYTWPMPSPIDLTYPRSTRAQNSKSPTSNVIIEHVDPEQLKGAGPGAKVYVTVTGRLETRVHFEMVHRGDGKVVPYGYGHLAACPAQIVYEVIKDTTIVPSRR